MSLLRRAAENFNLTQVAALVAGGERDDEAFLSDLGSTLGADDPNTPKRIAGLAKQGRVVENENQALKETQLLAAGADVHACDKAKMTPLLTAGMVGRAAAAQQLLAAGADLEARDYQGRTALHWACGNDRLGTFEVLRAAGADMAALDEAGNTPADMAKPQVLARILDTTTPSAHAIRTGPRI